MSVQSAPLGVGHPDQSEYAPFYASYIARVTEEALPALESQGQATQVILKKVSDAKAGHRYAPEKWTVREMIGHMADTERIMGYRVLRIARADSTPLEGFDEGAYVRAAGADVRPWPVLVEDLAIVRAGTLALLRGLDAAAWKRRGTANGATISVRALAHIIVGHERHHLEILRTRYGIPTA
jgi:DinB superfamily